jgi:magnesium-transporting ATPase (P-type)
MATLHRTSAGHLLAIKGRPDQILGRCAYIGTDGERRPIRSEDRSLIESENEKMAGTGLPEA